MKKLSPKLEVWLKTYHQTLQTMLANGFDPTPRHIRSGMADLTRSLVTDHPKIPWMRDDRVDVSALSVPVRIYHPQPGTELPILIYFHGGGHMAGSVDIYDPICRKLSLATRHIVISVDYRLAPEYPYPAGVEDAYGVVTHVWDVLERHQLKYQNRLSMAGDSAGGALCATVAHKAQHDPRLAVHRQILIYPSLDYTLSLPSLSIYGEGYLLEKTKIEWYFDHYFHDTDDRIAASPLHMEVTPNLAESLVITAEFCPLRDEGMAYVDKLKRVGVRAEHLHFDDMVHAFLNLEDLAKESCRQLYQAAELFLNS